MMVRLPGQKPWMSGQKIDPLFRCELAFSQLFGFQPFLCADFRALQAVKGGEGPDQRIDDGGACHLLLVAYRSDPFSGAFRSLVAQFFPADAQHLEHFVSVDIVGKHGVMQHGAVPAGLCCATNLAG